MAATLVCCNRNKTIQVTPQTTQVTVAFVVPESYVVEAPQQVVLQAGQEGGELPFPEGAESTDEHRVLQWYYDELCSQPYDPAAPIEVDTVLYLGETAKVYTITYVRNDNLTYQGDFPTQYTYGQDRLPLPRIVGKGYANWWHCVQTDTMCTAVPTTAGEDLTFEVPAPIELVIPYSSGMADVDIGAIDNHLNPATINVLSQPIRLQAPVYGDKQFVAWVVRLSSGAYRTVDGVRYYDGTSITTLTYNMVASGYFTSIEAIWN